MILCFRPCVKSQLVLSTLGILANMPYLFHANLKIILFTLNFRFNKNRFLFYLGSPSGYLTYVPCRLNLNYLKYSLHIHQNPDSRILLISYRQITKANCLSSQMISLACPAPLQGLKCLWYVYIGTLTHRSSNRGPCEQVYCGGPRPTVLLESLHPESFNTSKKRCI